MATPPRGTLAFSGFGDAPIQFVSPAGVLLSLGITADCGAGTDGIITLPISGKVAVCGGNSPNFGTYGNGVFAADFASSVEGNLLGAGSSAAADGSDNYYGLHITSLHKYNSAGVHQASWDLSSIFTTPSACGVNAAGTRAFIASVAAPTDKVYQWDISGAGSSLGIFTTETGYWVRSDCAILVLSNGDVLVGWQAKFPTTGPGYVKHYDSSGTLLYTYTLPDTNNVSDPLCIRESTTSGKIWVSYYDGDATTSSGVSLVEITLVTGATSTKWSPDDGAGFEFEGSFTVLTAGARVNTIIASGTNTDGQTYGVRDDTAALAVHTESEGGLLAIVNLTAGKPKAFTGRVLDDGTPDFECNGPNEDIQINTIPTTWVHKATITLTAAQIKSFKTTPVQVLAAPGANTAVIPIAAILDFLAGGTQMTSGGAVSLVDHGTHTNVLAGSVPAATIQSASSSATHLGQQAGANGLARPANTAIDIEAATADFATGNGTAVVHLWYCLIPTNQ